MSSLNTRDAVPEAADAAAPEQKQYLTFMLGRETLAIGILAIKEIIGYVQPTEVPMMPAFIRGVINLRGAVVPVLDLATRLNRASAGITRKTCFVIVEAELEGERQVIGISVDAVNEVLEIPAAQIEPAPAFGASIRTEYLAGIGKVNGRFVIILDVDHVLTSSEMAALTSELSTASAA